MSVWDAQWALGPLPMAIRPCLYKTNKRNNCSEAGPGHGPASGQGPVEESLTIAKSHFTRTIPRGSWKFWMLVGFWCSCSRHRASTGGGGGVSVVPLVATGVLVVASGFRGRLGIVAGMHFASPSGGPIAGPSSVLSMTAHAACHPLHPSHNPCNSHNYTQL